MQYSFATILAIAAGVSAQSNVTYTTEVVTALTTYCPYATVLTHAGSTYTISEVCHHSRQPKPFKRLTQLTSSRPQP